MKWLLLLSFFLSGCISTYEPPKNNSQPSIRIDMKNINRLTFFEEGKDCSQVATLKAPYNPHRNDALPLPVRGNQLLAFQLIYSQGREGCSAIISFFPHINHDYVIYNKVKYDQRYNMSCSFKVIRKHRADQTARWQNEETLKFRKQVKALKSDARHCR